MVFMDMSKLGKPNLTFIDPGVKIYGIAVICCWLSRYCLSEVRFLASSLFSSKTVLQHLQDNQAS